MSVLRSNSPINGSDSDPTVSFADRIAVAGNCSFGCLAVSAVWSGLFFVKPSLAMSSILVLSAPLVATGLLVLLAGFSKNLIPKPRLSMPLPFTLPIIWCLLCYMAILLISTQSSETRVIPEPLLASLAWTKLRNLIRVCIAQIAVLGMFAWLSERKEHV